MWPTWRIYYGDGTTYSDLDGSVWDAPAVNVCAIAFVDQDPTHRDGRAVVQGFDFYWHDERSGEWYGGELFGLFDHLTQPGPKRVVFGRTVPNEDFRRVVRTACNDPDFDRSTRLGRA